MAYTTTDLIPRSVNKRKSSQTPAGPSRITKPAFAFQEPRRATPIPETEEYQDQLISLVTCAITECSVSEDFKIRLRTPQGCEPRTSLVFHKLIAKSQSSRSELYSSSYARESAIHQRPSPWPCRRFQRCTRSGLPECAHQATHVRSRTIGKQ